VVIMSESCFDCPLQFGEITRVPFGEHSAKTHPIAHSYLKSLNLFLFFKQNIIPLTCYILPRCRSFNSGGGKT